MTFPVVIEHPIYKLTLPTNGSKIEFRPFLEKERKILLMALETQNTQAVQTAIKQIAKNCLVSEIDIDKMAVIDLEYFFLQLRAKSRGEIFKLNFRCDNPVNEKICGHQQEVEVNIDNIKIENLKTKKEKDIKLNDNITVRMKYPPFGISDENLSDIEYTYDLLAASIESVFNGEEVFHTKDYPATDLYFFITNLPVDYFDKLTTFINDLPILKTQLQFTCQKCGFKHDFPLEGIDSFFV